ncbi:glycoside hydrolase family 15 protein [Nocardiopsis lambiniae]|uniref:Glycoside hydrolase family 15 protein n=1 Tax=Nocardiopsis lambiniae TaxID=3075539 RepID=A0ABU2M2J7_9ACTN|nr:glycoside hydrolase family 15 protein [Nocardiopsis sp. DSM 44743]MDT0326869.1 glycoside hydrolase family 15 protein [Nocardiopsis sp. DSM 44743]
MERTRAGIGEHGFLSDCHTAALTGPDGAIVWMCAPAFDGSAPFAGLLDPERGGSWSLEVDGARPERRAYLDGTLVLESLWRGPGGEVAVLDLMPLRRDGGRTGLYREGLLLRMVECRSGTATVRSRVAARPDFGRARPAWKRQDGHLREASGLSLSGTPDPWIDDDGDVEWRTTLSEGETSFLALDHLEGERSIDAREARDLLEETVTAWRAWSARCDYQGVGAEHVHRSALVLRGLLHEETGGLIAAPTTSLPEWPGGERNWDYRYVWHRDAALVVLAFMRLGHTEEAGHYLHFLLSMCGEPQGWIPPVQTIRREEPPEEEELDHLSGYAGSRPVRVGNNAYGQHQLDVYGHILDAALYYQEVTGDLSEEELDQLLTVVGVAVDLWREPDEGVWEVRADRRHWTNSKVYAWVCLDRGIRLVRLTGREEKVPLDRWRAERDAIRAEVLERGYDSEAGYFIRYYGSSRVDGSLLRIPLLGFLDGDDPRVKGTLDRVDAELGEAGFLVHRYDTDATDDGLGSPEGAFLLCSYDMVSALTLAGRRGEARRRFEELCGRAGPLGLQSEQMTADGTMLGNFPQSFTHLALIEAAMNLEYAQDAEALHAWVDRRGPEDDEDGRRGDDGDER